MASADALKKAFLIGVGASVVTAEKVSDFVKDVVDDLVERGEMTAADARDLADDLKKRVTRNVEKKMQNVQLPENVKALEENIRKNVEVGLKTAVRSLGLVTQDDLKKFRDDLTRKQAVQGAMRNVAEKSKSAKKTNGAKPKAKAGSASKKSKRS